MFDTILAVQAVVCIENMKSHYNVVIELICMQPLFPSLVTFVRPLIHEKTLKQTKYFFPFIQLVTNLLPNKIITLQIELQLSKFIDLAHQR